MRDGWRRWGGLTFKTEIRSNLIKDVAFFHFSRRLDGSININVIHDLNGVTDVLQLERVIDQLLKLLNFFNGDGKSN
jgi:hypothetical protein